tara:strand:- start:1442 stop:2092 length:651 start_codon:yes stop_codon:yes gene_type:complete
MQEVFWFNDISILYKNCYIYFPHRDFSLIKNLNAVVRFFILYSVLCFVVYQDTDVFMPLLLVMFISIILYYIRDRIQEPYENLLTPNKNDKPIKIKRNETKPIETVLRTSTQNNPMMNINVMDYNNNKNIKIDENITNEDMNKNLNNDIFNGIGDMSNNNMLERNFYTTPIHSIPNDQGAFAKWLYDTGPTCKENTKVCADTVPERLSMGRGANSP